MEEHTACVFLEAPHKIWYNLFRPVKQVENWDSKNREPETCETGRESEFEESRARSATCVINSKERYAEDEEKIIWQHETSGRRRF